MFIICYNDPSKQIIKQFTFQTVENKLIINAHTKNVVYQTELIAGTTERTIEEYQTFFDQDEYEYVSHDFETFKLISYDVDFTLVNKEILTLNQLKQQKDKTYDQIWKLKDELEEKEKELEQIKQKITAVEEELKRKFSQSEFKLKIKKRM